MLAKTSVTSAIRPQRGDAVKASCNNRVMRIPTTVVTGHLGAGKTTAIGQLLQHKPAVERWAVIVNEFGELGIDGATLRRTDSGVLIEEITGACICCGMGAPLLFVLEQLLDAQQFDRLLIEPTGLAEPTAVADAFTAPTLRDRLVRRVAVCLVDVRQIARERWQHHATFQRQLYASECVVGTFADEATDDEKAAFLAFARDLEPSRAGYWLVENGRLPAEVLDLQPVDSAALSHAGDGACGAINVATHTGDESSRSLRFAGHCIVDRSALTAVLNEWAPRLLRGKGFVRTAYGFKRWDLDGGGTLRWQTIAAAPESQLQLIAPVDFAAADWQAMTVALERCVRETLTT